MPGQQILVVEDNEKNMKLVRDVLQAIGYRHPRGGHGRGPGDGSREHTHRPWS